MFQKFRVQFILLLIFFTAFGSAAGAGGPEYRVLWVTRSELANSANIPILVERAAQNNFNALFVQVCGRGTAYYNSEILPKDDQVNGYDPLAILIREAAKYNLEVHAWINTLYVWSSREKPTSPRHVLNAHPEWILGQANQEHLFSLNHDYFLNPARPEVRNYLKAVYLEVAQKYKVAGIHFDYIRLPGQEEALSDQYSRALFEKENGVDPKALLMNKRLSLKLYGETDYKNYLTKWREFNQNNVSLTLATIVRELLKAKPQLLISAAVIADHDRALQDYAQDWGSWMEKGLIDFVVPMAYDTHTEVVQKQIVYVTELAGKYECPVLIGLGAWRLPVKTISSLISYVRQIREEMGYKELAGVALFSYDELSRQKEYLQDLKENSFGEAVQPPRFAINKKRFVELEKLEPQSVPAPTYEDDEIDLKYHTNIIG